MEATSTTAVEFPSCPLFSSQKAKTMLPLRSAAAAPCSVAGLLLHRFSSCSSSSVYSVRHHASPAVSSQPTTCSTTTWSPSPHSSSPRIRGFAAWASAPGQAGSADSPATKALEAKVPRLPPRFSFLILIFVL